MAGGWILDGVCLHVWLAESLMDMYVYCITANRE